MAKEMKVLILPVFYIEINIFFRFKREKGNEENHFL